MSSQEEQIQQRQANLAELAKLGIEIYPRTFERRHTISELVDAYGQRSHDELEGDHIETITGGRILAIRAFGKARCTSPTCRKLTGILSVMRSAAGARRRNRAA